MAKLAIFIALALFAAATAFETTSESTMTTSAVVCPTERPCCSCKCIPKECGYVPMAKHCEFIHCLFKCPHQCDEEHKKTTPEVEITTTPVTCPTTRPCCTCACPPKGCPEVPRPDHCKRMKCLIKCPHVCEHA